MNTQYRNRKLIRIAFVAGLLIVTADLLLRYGGPKTPLQSDVEREREAHSSPPANSDPGGKTAFAEETARNDASQAPSENPVREFRGELWLTRDGSRSQPAGSSSLTLVRASELSSTETGGGGDVHWAASTGVVSLEDWDAGAKPSVHEGEVVIVVDGEWTMPIPSEDLFVWEGRGPSGEALLLEGDRLIEADSTRAEVESREAPLEELVVLDAHTHLPLQDVEIRIAAELEQDYKIRDIHVTKPTRYISRAESTDSERSGPEPPDWAELYLKAGASPMAVPALDTRQVLWVGSRGYSWKAISWPAESEQAVVKLLPSGTLEIAISGTGELKRPVRVIVSPATSATSDVTGRDVPIGWKKVKRDRVLSVKQLPAGPCDVQVLDERRGGTIGDFKSVAIIEPAVTTRVDVNLAEIFQGPYGSLDVGIVANRAVDDASSLLVIAPCHDEVMGAPFFSHQLRNLEHREGGYGVHLGSLNTGRYMVALSPSGIERVVDVTEGSVSDVTLDLSQASTLRVFPLDLSATHAERLRLTWSKLPSELLGDSDEEQPVGGLVQRHFLRRPARWSEDHWSLPCPPGDVWLHLRDESDRLVNAAQVTVVPGPNEVSLDLSSSEVFTLPLTCDVAEDGLPMRLERHLLRAIRPIRGEGRCIDATWEVNSRELVLAFTEPGSYAIEWSTLPESLRPTEAPERLRIPPQVETQTLSW